MSQSSIAAPVFMPTKPMGDLPSSVYNHWSLCQDHLDNATKTVTSPTMSTVAMLSFVTTYASFLKAAFLVAGVS